MTCLSSPNSFHHIKEAPGWYNNIDLQLKELQGSEPKERVSREIQRQQRRQNKDTQEILESAETPVLWPPHAKS